MSHEVDDLPVLNRSVRNSGKRSNNARYPKWVAMQNIMQRITTISDGSKRSAVIKMITKALNPCNDIYIWEKFLEELDL